MPLSLVHAVGDALMSDLANEQLLYRQAKVRFVLLISFSVYIREPGQFLRVFWPKRTPSLPSSGLVLCRRVCCASASSY